MKKIECLPHFCLVFNSSFFVYSLGIEQNVSFHNEKCVIRNETLFYKVNWTARIRCQHKYDHVQKVWGHVASGQAQQTTVLSLIKLHLLLKTLHLYKLLSFSSISIFFLSSADLINIFFFLVTMAMRSVDMMLNWIFPELLCSPLVSEIFCLFLVFLSALVLHFVYVYAFRYECMSRWGIYQIFTMNLQQFCWWYKIKQHDELCNDFKEIYMWKIKRVLLH